MTKILMVHVLNAIIIPLQAVATRDSMAKCLYASLFDWIVDQVGLFSSFSHYEVYSRILKSYLHEVHHTVFENNKYTT